MATCRTSASRELLALAAGLLAGLLSGVFGIGGGIVLVPLLGLLLGLGQQDAQGVTLAVLLLPIGLPAVLAYRKRVTIRWWLVAALVAGFVVAVARAPGLANALDGEQLRGGLRALRPGRGRADVEADRRPSGHPPGTVAARAEQLERHSGSARSGDSWPGCSGSAGAS